MIIKTTVVLYWSGLTAIATQNLSSLTQSMFIPHSSHSSLWVGKEALALPTHSGVNLVTLPTSDCLKPSI